jgi:HEAT repeat protein
MADFRPTTWNGEPIPYHASVEILRTLTHKSGEKAAAVICALAASSDPAAMAILIDLTRSPDPYLRKSAVEGIGNNPSGRDAADVVISLLHDGNGFVVRVACRAAAVLCLSKAHERIQRLLEAKEEATRHSAIEALAILWKPSDFEQVFERYLWDRSDNVRKWAAWTLKDNVDLDHWERLFKAWSSDPLPRHRVCACTLVQKFATSADLAMLNPFFSDPDGHVRHAADHAARGKRSNPE